MPDGAGLYEFSDVYTAGTHVRKIEGDLRDIVQTVDVPRFGIRELSSLRELAYSVWTGGTDLPSVWQNGLLGYESKTGRTTFIALDTPISSSCQRMCRPSDFIPVCWRAWSIAPASSFGLARD